MGEQEVNEITQTSEDQWIPHNAGEDLPTEFFGAVEKGTLSDKLYFNDSLLTKTISR